MNRILFVIGISSFPFPTLHGLGRSAMVEWERASAWEPQDLPPCPCSHLALVDSLWQCFNLSLLQFPRGKETVLYLHSLETFEIIK